MSSQQSYSIEVFPPKAPDALVQLRETRAELEKLGPKYFSITYGAGGSTQQGTYNIVKEILSEGFEPAPHITCIGATRDKVREQIAEYKRIGVRHIVALRGDLPNDYGDLGEFHYANELVEFIRQETGDWFRIDVAAYPEKHPQAASIVDDVANFVRKAKAGADVAITQYFYNPDAYFRFVEDIRKAGTDIPVIAGIMPITNCNQLVRFSDMCGAQIPLWIRHRLEAYGKDLASIRAFGHDVVLELCHKLKEGGADGLHFYSLNRAEATIRLWRELGLKNG